MEKVDQRQEDGDSSSSANGVDPQDWKTCPICEHGGTQSPRFNEFLPLIHHLIEHETGVPRPGYVPIHVPDPLDDFFEQLGQPRRRRLDARTCQRMLVKAVMKYLPRISDWLEQTLKESQELASIQESGIPTAEWLSKIVRSLPELLEQREYLLEYEERLKETGKDPKWPRTMGSQARFVSESMAGAAWSLAPTTSREYVRRRTPRKRVFRDKRKSYERTPRRIDGRVQTSRDYEQ